MTMKKRTLYLTTLLFTLFSYGQNCQKNLDDAKRAYFNGNFLEVERLIIPCLKNGFDQRDKEDALKLLTNIKLIANDDEVADQYMADLLTVNPQHQVRSTDITEFQRLFDTYKLTTRYSVGLVAGINFSDYQIMKYQSLASLTDEPIDYEEKTGLTIGLTGDYQLMNNWYATASLLLQTFQFEQQEIMLQSIKVSSNETSFNLSLPVQLKYMIDTYKFKPFIGAGMMFNYMMKTKADIEHYPIPTNGVIVTTNSQFVEDYDLTKQRRHFLPFWTASTGFQQNLGKYSLELKFSYCYGLRNLVKENERYTDNILMENYGYISDDFKMDSYSVTLGVIRTILKPDKK
jgi:hypothetical protein